MSTRSSARTHHWLIRLTAIAVTLLSTTAGLVVTSAPAQAGGCRVAPYSGYPNYSDLYMLYDGVEIISQPQYPKYLTTTSQCSDIQIRNTGDNDYYGPFDACINFYGRATCNYWTHVPVGQWRNLATNVKDGTKFYIWIRIDLGRWYGFKAAGDW